MRDDLAHGRPVSWQFIPDQKRLSIVLPKLFGGQTHQVCMTGGYTFAA